MACFNSAIKPGLRALATLCLYCALPAVALDKPHILVFLADDLGWNDVGYHGSHIQTPNIDQIASAGIELDRFYVQPTCSPTRTALMTGKSPISLGVIGPINKHSRNSVPLEEKLLPEYLNEQGYQSFLVGKWHLGKRTRAHLPNARGFEHAYGSLTGGVGYWSKIHGGGYDWHRNGEVVRETGYVTHLVVDEIRALIAARRVEQPNFMYVAFQAPHLPNEAPAATIEKYGHLEEGRAVHAAMVDEMDVAIGEILHIYEEADMLNNTIVFFMSDNGGAVPPNPDPALQSPPEKLALMLDSWFGRPIPPFPIPGLEFITSNVLDGRSDNAPLPGGKTQLWEGGVRVPAAIWMPGKLEQSQHVGFFSVSDVLPTLLDLVGASAIIPADLQGRSQVAALTGNPTKPADYVVADLLDGFALYHWPWKFVDKGEMMLFHLVDDPLEQNNVLDDFPEVAADLDRRLANWPYGDAPGPPWSDILFDPDTFGGAETRAPWLNDIED